MVHCWHFYLSLKSYNNNNNNNSNDSNNNNNGSFRRVNEVIITRFNVLGENSKRIWRFSRDNAPQSTYSSVTYWLLGVHHLQSPVKAVRVQIGIKYVYCLYLFACGGVTTRMHDGDWCSLVIWNPSAIIVGFLSFRYNGCWTWCQIWLCPTHDLPGCADHRNVLLPHLQSSVGHERNR